MLKSPYFEAACLPAEGPWATKRRLAAAIRKINALLVTTDAPEEALAAAAEAAERFASTLDAHPHREGVRGYAEASLSGDTGAFFDQSPMVGLCNPVSPPMRLETDGERVRGTVTFGAPYEGPPGHVHGGFIAAAFDEILGLAQCTTGNPGMTASLEVRYRAPTPLHRPLRLEATVESVKGRKIMTRGTLKDGDRLTAEASGLFISIDSRHFAGLLEGRERARAEGAGGDGDREN
jgi:acyl-coenzyme A thioesterase PaaI-like protein